MSDYRDLLPEHVKSIWDNIFTPSECEKELGEGYAPIDLGTLKAQSCDVRTVPTEEMNKLKKDLDSVNARNKALEEEVARLKSMPCAPADPLAGIIRRIREINDEIDGATEAVKEAELTDRDIQLSANQQTHNLININAAQNAIKEIRLLLSPYENLDQRSAELDEAFDQLNAAMEGSVGSGLCNPFDPQQRINDLTQRIQNMETHFATLEGIIDSISAKAIDDARNAVMNATRSAKSMTRIIPYEEVKDLNEQQRHFESVTQNVGKIREEYEVVKNQIDGVIPIVDAIDPKSPEKAALQLQLTDASRLATQNNESNEANWKKLVSAVTSITKEALNEYENFRGTINDSNEEMKTDETKIASASEENLNDILGRATTALNEHANNLANIKTISDSVLHALRCVSNVIDNINNSWQEFIDLNKFQKDLNTAQSEIGNAINPMIMNINKLATTNAAQAQARLVDIRKKKSADEKVAEIKGYMGKLDELIGSVTKIATDVTAKISQISSIPASISELQEVKTHIDEMNDLRDTINRPKSSLDGALDDGNNAQLLIDSASVSDVKQQYTNKITTLDALVDGTNRAYTGKDQAIQFAIANEKQAAEQHEKAAQQAEQQQKQQAEQQQKHEAEQQAKRQLKEQQEAEETRERLRVQQQQQEFERLIVEEEEQRKAQEDAKKKELEELQRQAEHKAQEIKRKLEQQRLEQQRLDEEAKSKAAQVVQNVDATDKEKEEVKKAEDAAKQAQQQANELEADLNRLTDANRIAQENAERNFEEGKRAYDENLRKLEQQKNEEIQQHIKNQNAIREKYAQLLIEAEQERIRQAERTASEKPLAPPERKEEPQLQKSIEDIAKDIIIENREKADMTTIIASKLYDLITKNPDNEDDIKEVLASNVTSTQKKEINKLIKSKEIAAASGLAAELGEGRKVLEASNKQAELSQQAFNELAKSVVPSPDEPRTQQGGSFPEKTSFSDDITEKQAIEEYKKIRTRVIGACLNSTYQIKLMLSALTG